MMNDKANSRNEIQALKQTVEKLSKTNNEFVSVLSHDADSTR